MKFDFSTPIKNMDGSVAVMDKKPITIGYMVSEALLAADPTEKDGAKKVHKYVLASKVYKDIEIEMDEKDVELIKECVGSNVVLPLVVGQIFEFLGQ